MDRLKVVSTSGPRLWYSLLWFIAVNGILSYGSIPGIIKSLIVLFALFIPWIWFVWSGSNVKSHWIGSEKAIWVDRVNDWILITLFAVAVVLRFFKLSTLHLWLTGDEGFHGFLAIDLIRNWNWRFFYTVGEHPPLLIWILRFFFKHFESPFFDIWFPSAVSSVLTLALGYLSARVFFSRSIALLTGLLLAYSFWPLEIGRFSQQGTLVPPLEVLCFLWLALWVKSKPQSSTNVWTVLLGLTMGLGTLTFNSWLVVLVFLFVTATVLFSRNYLLEKKRYFLFVLALSLSMIPFISAIFREGYGRHFVDITSASGWFSGSQQWLVRSDYITSIFWGSNSVSAYGPNWGGMLNPILDGLFMIGIVELWIHRKKALSLWILGGLLLCLAPAFLSADYVEMFRIVQAMPLILLIVAIGFQRMLLATPVKNRLMVVMLVMMISTGLDLYQLIKPSLAEGSVNKSIWKESLPDESFRAYQILKSASEQQGPGLIFTDFLLLSHGHTLSVTTYHFNAALNPDLDASKATWASVITNVNYGPFLIRQFPLMRWIPVGEDLSDDGGLAVGIVPITEENKERLQIWLVAHQYFHELNIQAEGILNNKKLYEKALEDLSDNPVILQKDRFLESIYGEWRAQYHYDPMSISRNIDLIQQVIAKGYPSAHLYYKLGSFYWASRQKEKAEKAFKEANQCPFNATQSMQALRLLGQSGM